MTTAPARQTYEVTEYVLGPGGLLERLAVVNQFHHRGETVVARWDQLDLTDPIVPG